MIDRLPETILILPASDGQSCMVHGYSPDFTYRQLQRPFCPDATILRVAGTTWPCVLFLGPWSCSGVHLPHWPSREAENVIRIPAVGSTVDKV
jgi:hypothetical protein